MAATSRDAQVPWSLQAVSRAPISSSAHRLLLKIVCRQWRFQRADASLADLTETFNANVEKLNSRLFTHLDYAVIGAR